MSEATTELELEGVVDGWVKVREPNGTESYVANVKVAGVELSLAQVSECKLKCDEYSFVRDYHPTLLVEQPQWYTPPRRGDDD